MVSFLAKHAAGYAYGKISYALTDYMTNPGPVEVYDSQQQRKLVVLMFLKPKSIDRREQIGLIVVGDIDQESMREVEKDLIAGIAMGFQISLEKHKEAKLKSANLKFLENTYSNYEFRFQEVGAYGASIGMGIYQYKHMRKEMKKVVLIKGIKWDEDFNNFLVKIREDKYSGTPVIKFWEKAIKENNWVIPSEVVKFWQYVNIYSENEAGELAENLYVAFKQNDTNEIKSVGRKIESYIYTEDKRRKKMMKQMKKKK